MSNQFEEGARGAKVAKLVEQLDRQTLKDGYDIFAPDVAEKLAKFCREMPPEDWLTLCSAAKVQTKRPPSETTKQNVIAVFERRVRECDAELDQTPLSWVDEEHRRGLEQDNGWREPAEDDDDYPF